MALSNLRRNPIDGTMSWRAIANEAHTVAELFELPGIYGFVLQDRPQAGSVTVTEDTTAATVFTIVSSAPLAGQVFVDFNENRGYCIFNSADNGKSFLVDYNGGGSNTTVDNIESLIPVGATAFTELSDVPASYTGQTLKAVRVNAGETALEFYTPSAGGNPTQVVISTAGPHDNYDVGTQPETVVLVTTGAATEIQGFLAKSNLSRIIIANYSIYTLTIKNNGSGTAADNIFFTDNADALLQLGESVEIAYISTQWAQIGAIRRATTVSRGIVASSAKTTPVAGDYFGITDSGASDVLKKLNYSDLETTVLSATNARLAAFWVNFNGTGTPAIRQSYNVSSITDNGSGNYTVNYAVALGTANYAVATGGINSDATGAIAMTVNPAELASASVELRCDYNNGTAQDFNQIHAVGFV